MKYNKCYLISSLQFIEFIVSAQGFSTYLVDCCPIDHRTEIVCSQKNEKAPSGRERQCHGTVWVGLSNQGRLDRGIAVLGPIANSQNTNYPVSPSQSHSHVQHVVLSRMCTPQGGVTYWFASDYSLSPLWYKYMKQKHHQQKRISLGLGKNAERENIFKLVEYLLKKQNRRLRLHMLKLFAFLIFCYRRIFSRNLI